MLQSIGEKLDLLIMLQANIKAATIYCEGVKADFEGTKIWMDNIVQILNNTSAISSPKDL